MALSPEIKKKVMEKIIPFVKSCPLCGNDNFTVNDYIYVCPTMQLETNKVDLRSVFPAIMIDCDNCHYTFIFHAIKAGIIEH